MNRLAISFIAALVIFSASGSYAKNPILIEFEEHEKQLSIRFDNAMTNVELISGAGGLERNAEKFMLAALIQRMTKTGRNKTRISLLKEQLEFYKFCRCASKEDSKEFRGRLAGMSDYLTRASRYTARFKELIMPNARYQLLKDIQKCKVRYNGQMSSLTFGELTEGTNSLFLLDQRWFGEIKNGVGRYFYAVLNPSYYGQLGPTPEPVASFLCIWRNGKFHAIHSLGEAVQVTKLTIKNEKILISTKVNRKSSGSQLISINFLKPNNNKSLK